VSHFLSRRALAFRPAFAASVAISLAASLVLVAPVAADGELDWADQFGSAGDDQGPAIAVTDEAAYAVGYRGTSYLRKYLPNGDMEWERSLPTSSIEAVAADASGIYIGGETTGLPGEPAPHGDVEYYVARYSPAGSLVWARQFFLGALGDLSSRRGTALVQVTSAGVFITGAGETTSFIRMFDRDGNTLWTRNVPLLLETFSADATGALVVSSNTDFLSPTMRSFSNAGALRFTRPAPGYRHTAAAASSGEFYLGYSRAVSGFDRGFITHFNAGGLATWTHRYGGNWFYQWGGIVRFGTRLYVASREFVGSFGGPVLDQWAALSAGTGDLIWHHEFAVEPGSEVRPASIAVAAHGGYVTGEVEGALAGHVSSGGSLDAFVMKFTIDTAPPNILVSGYAVPPRVPLTIDDFTLEGRWTLSDDISGVSRVELQETSDGTTWNDVALPEPRATSALIDLKPNEAHRFRIRAIDRSGNAGKWVVSKLFQTNLLQEDTDGASYDADWKPATLAGANGGSVMTTSTIGATATFSFKGDAIGLVVSRGPDRGAVSVYLDGVKVRTLDLYAANSRSNWLVFSKNYNAVRGHVLELVAKGTTGRPRVDIDAFEVRVTSP
jgi:hypothetical protein